MHVHELTAFRPDALATYLAGLGVLRLLAEQRDPGVRAFWHNERFVVVTILEWAEIEKFFVEDYAPTPILAPWNMESGFFSLKPDSQTSNEFAEGAVAEDEDASEPTGEDRATDDESEEEAEDATEQAVGVPLLDQFRHSAAPRFSALRRGIDLSREAIPPGLRRAEEDVRRAHEEITKRAEKRSREKELKDAERAAKQDAELKAEVAAAKKKFKEVQSSNKERLIADLRSQFDPAGQQWVDAAVALDERNKRGFEFTSLFGSGGNDGRMEFTKNFREHLALIRQ